MYALFYKNNFVKIAQESDMQADLLNPDYSAIKFHESMLPNWAVYKNLNIEISYSDYNFLLDINGNFIAIPKNHMLHRYHKKITNELTTSYKSTLNKINNMSFIHRLKFLFNKHIIKAIL